MNGRKNYKIYLDDVIRIIVYFLSDGNEILKFVVKIEYFYNNEWIEMERYDCYHDCIHKDILNKKGKKKRQIKYVLADLKSGLNFAIKEFKENYKFILWRFLNED